jgi:hypothetical protein
MALGAEARSLRHYFDVVIGVLTNFDSKGYLSLRYLVTRPGFLSSEQLRGSRVKYAKPLALFLAINVLYYISSSLIGANTFTTPLSIQLHQNDYYAQLADRQVAQHMRTTSEDATAFEAKYNQRTNVLSKTLIFFFIPIYALLFQAMLFFRRRYFVEHAVVATHLWSFILLLLAAVVPLAAFALKWWSDAPSLADALASNDNAITILLQLCIATYLTLMLRHVYAVRRWYCFTVAVLIAWAFFQIVWLYRFLLFEITLRTL